MSYQKEYEHCLELFIKKDYLSSIKKTVTLFQSAMIDVVKKYVKNQKSINDKNKVLDQIKKIGKERYSLESFTFEDLVRLFDLLKILDICKPKTKIQPACTKLFNFKILLEYKNALMLPNSHVLPMDAELFIIYLKLFLYQFDFIMPDILLDPKKEQDEYVRSPLTLEHGFLEEMKPEQFNLISKDIRKNDNGSLEATCLGIIDMVYIPAGTFIMGSKDKESFPKEKPPHEIYLDAFWISKYEITFHQFDKYCEEMGIGLPKCEWERGNNPVINVTWQEASNYCQWLSEKSKMPFSLPTEAQWEKVAKGNKESIYPWGDQEPNQDLCNFEFHHSKIVPVNQYPPGASGYGVMDMGGNVWEWCLDWYDENYYANAPRENPQGPGKGSSKCIRGGGWGYDASFLRNSNRNRWVPDDGSNVIGFRVVFQE